MNDLVLKPALFCTKPFWTIPISNVSFLQHPSCVSLFDHNGYDLSPLEKMYSRVNSSVTLKRYRGTHSIMKKDWFTQPRKNKGVVLNHGMILERKGYGGEALQQLTFYSKMNPMLQKIICFQTKWGY